MPAATREKTFYSKNATINLDKANSVIVQNQGNTDAYFDDILVVANGGSLTLTEKDIAGLIDYDWSVKLVIDETGVTVPVTKILVYKIFYNGSSKCNRCG